MNNNNTSKNGYVEPNAKEAMKQFKMETAREVDVPSTYYEIITDEQ